MQTVKCSLTARTLGMEYQASEVDCRTGIKSRNIGRDIYARGRRIVGGGYGTYVTATYAHFILRVEIAGEKRDIWTERSFKEALDIRRLTEQVRGKIERTMPERVEVEEREGRRGTKYYVLSEQTIEEWVARIRNVVGWKTE